MVFFVPFLFANVSVKPKSNPINDMFESFQTTVGILLFQIPD